MLVRRAVVAVWFFTAGVAHAQSDDARTARARELFVRGAELARLERWADALAAFEQSALLRPHGATLYDVGYCERALGHPTRSHKALALALARSDLPPGMRPEAERYLAEAEAKVARLTLTGVPRGATVAVDGRPLEHGLAGGDTVALAGTREPGPGEGVESETLEIWLDPGSHALVVAPPSGSPRVETIRLAAAGRARLALSSASAAPVADVAPAPSRDARRTAAALVLGGVGAVALLAGGWLGLRASSRWSDAKDACPQRTTCPDDRGADLSAGARRDASLATVAVVVSASALAGASLLWLSSGDGAGRGGAPRALGITVGGTM